MTRYVVVFVGLALTIVGLRILELHDTATNDIHNLFNYISSPLHNLEFISSDTHIPVYDMSELNNLSSGFLKSWMTFMFSVPGGISCLFSGIGLIIYKTIESYEKFKFDVTSFFIS